MFETTNPSREVFREELAAALFGRRTLALGHR